MALLVWLIPVYTGSQITGQRGLTPSFFPYCITIVIRLPTAILGSLSILLIYKGSSTSQAEATRAEDKRVTQFTILCILLFLGYYMGIKVIGMIPVSILILFALIHLFGFRHWLLSILISVVFVVLLFLFFEKIAQVSIPRGFLFEGFY